MPATSMKLTMKVTSLFFDKQAVISRMDKARRRILSKAGAFIRRRARSSIRRRKRVSRPGEPPSAHSGDKVATLKNILFAYDPQSNSVVVGPVRLNQMQDINGFLVAGTVPQVMEFGGTVGIREKQVGGKWVRRGRRKPRPGQPQRVRRASYEPRPFMGPALAKELPNFPSLWDNALVRGAA